MLYLGNLLLEDFFRTVWKGLQPGVPSFVYHVRQGRRREAIAIQLTAVTRLDIMNNMCWLRNLRATANAYFSVWRDTVLGPLSHRTRRYMKSSMALSLTASRKLWGISTA